MAQPGLEGQLFSRSSILATPALQGHPLGGVRAISGGHSSQVASQEFAGYEPKSAGSAQPLQPAPLTSSSALEVKVPTTPSLASPQLSLARAATLTHALPSRFPAHQLSGRRSPSNKVITMYP